MKLHMTIGLLLAGSLFVGTAIQAQDLTQVKYPRVSYTDLDDLICKSEQPLSPNTLCV